MAAQWKQSDELVSEELGNETLVVSPRSGARWSLNAVAGAVWKWCETTRSSEDLAVALSSFGGRSLRTARAEIKQFCETLAQIGLLRAASDTATPIPMTVSFARSTSTAPICRELGLAGGPRRRPSPRGNSGPG